MPLSSLSMCSQCPRLRSHLMYPSWPGSMPIISIISGVMCSAMSFSSESFLRQWIRLSSSMGHPIMPSTPDVMSG